MSEDIFPAGGGAPRAWKKDPEFSGENGDEAFQASDAAPGAATVAAAASDAACDAEDLPEGVPEDPPELSERGKLILEFLEGLRVGFAGQRVVFATVVMVPTPQGTGIQQLPTADLLELVERDWVEDIPFEEAFAAWADRHQPPQIIPATTMPGQGVPGGGVGRQVGGRGGGPPAGMRIKL